MTKSEAKKVQRMFNGIAKSYDLGNDVLSFGMHRYWQNSSLSLLSKNKEFTCLDMCTGTGALLSDLSKKYKKVVGADFSEEMLSVAFQKYSSLENVEISKVDALNTPYESNTFDVITIAYGVRNFENLEQGLLEMKRVLKENGQLLIIEFGQPTGLFSLPYKLYSKYIMPVIGKFITGDSEAYKYLPETASEFPCGKKFQSICENLGYKSIKMKKFMFGANYCYLVVKS